jgi:hypothetical protein
MQAMVYQTPNGEAIPRSYRAFVVCLFALVYFAILMFRLLVNEHTDPILSPLWFLVCVLFYAGMGWLVCAIVLGEKLIQRKIVKVRACRYSWISALFGGLLVAMCVNQLVRIYAEPLTQQHIRALLSVLPRPPFH